MAGTAKTRTALQAQIDADINDNVLGEISPADVRGVMEDTIASVDYGSGWGFYVDSETAPATQTFNATASKLQIDGAGGGNTSYLPREIRGVSDLWDTTNDKILPVNLGDAYSIRIDMTVTGETQNPNNIILQLDIGGGATPSIVIVDSYISTGKGTPYTLSVAFPIFCLSNFIINGGQLFISTDAGAITVSSRAISIHRLSTN